MDHRSDIWSFGVVLYESDDDIVVINADSTKDIGWNSFEENTKKYFNSSENISYSFKDEFIKVHPSAKSAWVLFIQDGNEIYQDNPISFEGARATFGLEKRDDNWVIVQAHFSFPVSI